MQKTGDDGSGRGSPATSPGEIVEQAVIVRFAPVPRNLDGLYRLEDQLTDVLGRSGYGEYDGHDIALDGRDGYLYFYGPDADRILAAVQPLLRATSFLRGAVATKRYGPPDPAVRTEVVVIEP